MAFDLDVLGDSGRVIAANARRLVQAWAEGAAPPPRLSVSEWAEKYRRFDDDAPYPGPWRHETAPYLVEIMDALSPFDPCEEVILRKCAQSGGTAAIENWVGYVADVAPGPMMFVQATLKAALEWSSEKLWPMIEATPRLNPAKGGAIRPLGDTKAGGSTQHRLKFMRSSSYVVLAGGNSAPTLRQRTMRYAVEDDLDQFPDDLAGQGSPEAMISTRLKVFRRRGLSKRAKISTPTIKGASKIDNAFEAEDTDRRFFYYACPHCSDRFRIVWEPGAEGERDIQWPDGRPEEAYLVPRCCGTVIEHWQKTAMSRPDGWLSETVGGEKTPLTMTEAEFQALRAAMPLSRRRGFDIDGMLTTFQTWGDMAVEFVGCRGDDNLLKAWTMLTRGAAYELATSVPDYEKLMALREQDWGEGHIPAGPVVLTMATDVQGDGLYVEIVGWAENAESWSLIQRFIPGATDVEGEGAWLDLDKLSRTAFVFPGGRTVTIDQEVVDGGYNTHAVEDYCKRRPNRLVVFGRQGWSRPMIGRGENLKFERQGQRAGFASKKTEDKAYIVGIDSAKAQFYGFLRTTLAWSVDPQQDGDQRPRGLCHFGKDTPDEWFKMATAEHVVTEVKNGLAKKVWRPMKGRENHYLDARVYNIAAAYKLMLDTLTDADWARLRAERYGPRDEVQGDLLAGSHLTAPAAPKPDSRASAGFVDAGDDYL